jgi:3-oxoacyl-[acyl-carrier protein] reductase
MGRTILITGSAKRLGAALAKALAKEGHCIAIHFRSSRIEAEETRRAILDAGGAAAIFQATLSDLAAGERLVREVAAHFGSLDTLINNAGTFNRKRFDEMTQEEWDAGLASTVGAAFVATRAALPELRKSGRGRIINLGDSMSERTGFRMMTQTLAATEAPHKITVNMVSPGVLEGSICDTPVEEMPLGRYGTPEDVLGPIRFLLGEGTEALTGSNFQVGGGWNIRG